MLTFGELRTRLRPVLEELGLKDQEIDLYIQAVLLGPSPITVFADQLGMSASNVYKLIAPLERVGLSAFSTQKKKGKAFSVISPSILPELLQKRREEIERLTTSFLPGLTDVLASYRQGSAPARIRILEGEAAFTAAMRQMFHEVTGELFVWGSMDGFVNLISPKAFKALTEERLLRKIHLRSLICDTPLARSLKKNQDKELRTVKLIPATHSFTASMQLSKGKAIIWQPNTPLAVLIEDETIVEMWRQLFEWTWSMAK